MEIIYSYPTLLNGWHQERTLMISKRTQTNVCVCANNNKQSNQTVIII